MPLRETMSSGSVRDLNTQGWVNKELNTLELGVADAAVIIYFRHFLTQTQNYCILVPGTKHCSKWCRTKG